MTAPSFESWSLRASSARAMARAMLTLILAGLGSASAQISVIPAAPRVHETVRVAEPEGPFTQEIIDTRATRVAMDGSRITATLVVTGNSPVPAEPFPQLDLPLGQLPPGNFTVEVRVVSPAGTLIRSLGSTAFVVQPRSNTEPVWNITDLWWVPEESGWGLNVIQHGTGVAFATWFVYGADGRATWYVMPDGRWFAESTSFRGALYRTSGPEVCFGEGCPPFNPNAVTRTLVGELIIGPSALQFERAFMTARIDGRVFSRILRRQGF